MNIEIMRNTLYKAYLDDFAKFCNKMGGSTAAVMGDLLSFEVCSLHHNMSVCLSVCLCLGSITILHILPLWLHV
jgi:hypothetical protein